MIKRKIKIFSYPWHYGHQHELRKLPFAEFYYLRNYVKKWNWKTRPVPEEKFWVDYYEPGKYDLAIIHIDHSSIHPHMSSGKTTLFRDVDSLIKDIPKIYINHSVPFWPEIYNAKTGEYSEEFIIEQTKKAVGKSTMIVNSHQACEMWGFGKTIWHGLDHKEWFDLPKEPRVITTLAEAGWDAYYGRMLLAQTETELQERYGIYLQQILVDFVAESFDDYRDFLGRSLIYFNPTYQSPMPRSRTEAMLSGCCVITTRHHDAEMFIENGKNGFIVPDNPEVCARIIAQLLWEGYPEAVKLGKAGRETAKEVLGMERYQKDWKETIENVLGDKIEISK